MADRDSALELGSRLHSCSTEIPGEGKGCRTQGTRKLHSRPVGQWDLDGFGSGRPLSWGILEMQP